MWVEQIPDLEQQTAGWCPWTWSLVALLPNGMCAFCPCRLDLQAADGRRLREAAKEGDVAAVEACLAAGVAVDDADGSGFTALHLAADCGHEAMARLMLDKGAAVGANTLYGDTPLHTHTHPPGAGGAAGGVQRCEAHV